MIRMTCTTEGSDVCYRGLRMTAEEFMRLPECEITYELIDGVVFMSPSSTPAHQRIISRISYLIETYLDQHPIGAVYVEVDANLGAHYGRHLVYRPDVVYLRKERAEESHERISGAPDLVVEVISPDSRQYDSITKKDDYERCGVTEYWLIDPLESKMTFYVRRDEKFVDAAPVGDTFASSAIPGFSLELTRIRQLFKTPK